MSAVMTVLYPAVTAENIRWWYWAKSRGNPSRSIYSLYTHKVLLLYPNIMYLLMYNIAMC